MTYLSNVIKQKDEKVKKVVEKVCAWHGLFPHTLFKRGRKRPIVEARQEAWYFVRRNVLATNGSKISLSEIGKLSCLWGFDSVWDHASVLHAVRLIDGRKDVDKMYSSHIEKMEGEIIKMIMEMEGDNLITDQYKPTMHYHQMLGHLNYNLSVRNDSEEVDFLIKTLDEKRINESSNQDSQEDLEVEMVQRAIN